jgi:hypothetical protein
VVVVFLAGILVSFLEELVTELAPEVAVLSEPLVFLAPVGDCCVFLLLFSLAGETGFEPFPL